ncbi:MAG: YihY/virulence factor BrkB family protein [Lachnospiraceae bacterium]|nr:YihY/virulence factor BrkB family protein [Lachnospiraceae bacterium]
MKQNRLTHFLKHALPYFEQFALHMNASNISAHAGEAAFFIILSFFPFTMFLCSLVRLTPLTEEILINAIQAVFPTSFHDYLGQLINEIYNHYSTAILSVTIITAVWLGSKAFMSLIRGLNDMYQITESRKFIRVRILSLVYTALFAVLILVTLILLVFGNTLYYHFCTIFPWLHDTLLSIISIRSIVCFLVMLLFFTFMYMLLPNHRAIQKNSPAYQSGFLSQLPGGLITTTGWILFAYLYSYYVDHLSNYSFFYGTMTTIALLMVWLYACMYLLFLGGVINHLMMDFELTSQPEK